jgi:DNA-directed RNA polymerase beta' subunit
MTKCKEIIRERGKKKGEIPLANPPLHIMYVIIDNIFLSYNLLEHYVSPLQMETIKKVVKHFIMLEL